MARPAAAVRFVFAEFGPLIAFWALALTLGVTRAIAGSILFIVADAAWRWRKGFAFTRLYLLVSELTLVFGAIDLVSVSPFILKYEAAVTNVATGAAFVVGATIVDQTAHRQGQETAPAGVLQSSHGSVGTAEKHDILAAHGSGKQRGRDFVAPRRRVPGVQGKRTAVRHRLSPKGTQRSAHIMLARPVAPGKGRVLQVRPRSLRLKCVNAVARRRQERVARQA